MKIILSVEAIRYPLTGTGRYAFELARHLPEIDGVEEVRFFAGGGFTGLPEPAETPSRVSGTLRRVLQKSDMVVGLRQAILNGRAEKSLRACPEHVFHGPNFYLPPRSGRNVVTIHDLSIFTMPECHPPERVRHMRREIGLSVERASRIVTDCEFTRQEVSAYFDWPTDRIDAIPLAASDAYRPRDAAELAAPLARHGLRPQAYCLFAGTIEPRKNLERLIAAYGDLPADLRGETPLVVVGHRGWRSEAVHKAMIRGGQEGWIRYLGYVPQADLPALYAGARLFVLPSLYEGFGLPLLEAMASGTPATVSKAASLPEVAGDAALVFDPLDTDAIGAALMRGLTDEAWRGAAVARGLRRAATFSWRRCARETVEAYRRIGEG